MARDADEATELATRLLARRDISRQALTARLEQAGVAADVAEQTAARLARLGYVDDRRLAAHRAASLAHRGYGDRSIADRLTGEGVDPQAVVESLAALPPELERAGEIAARTAGAERLVATLRRRGFDEDVIEAAVSRVDDEPRAELR